MLLNGGEIDFGFEIGGGGWNKPPRPNGGEMDCGFEIGGSGGGL